MRMGIRTGVFALLFFPSLSFASLEGELQSQFFQYASDNSPTLSFSARTLFENQDFMVQLYGYEESGPKGTWSLDPDPLRETLKLDDSGNNLIWFGRDQPLNLTRGNKVEPYSALGSIWAQNDLDALNPRVSGWIGAGAVKELMPGWKLNFAYSPLFLPTFGPSLGFTDRGELNPSRFARLPPQRVDIDGNLVPIRYQLQIGQISQLVFQHQVFLGVAHEESSFAFDVYAYTAPDPNPVPLTNAALAVGQDTVNAKVQIDAQFPREYWSGARLQLKDIIFQPSFEIVQNLQDYTYHVVSLTTYFDAPNLNPLVAKKTAKSAIGLLSHFQKQFDSPQYSDFLIFLRMPFDLTNEFSINLFTEATLLSLRQSWYGLAELEYKLRKNFSLLGAIRVLSGRDNSYFGDWRQEGSVSAGIKWVW